MRLYNATCEVNWCTTDDYLTVDRKSSLIEILEREG